MKTTIARYPVLAAGLAIGLVLAGADLLGGGSPLKAASSLAIVLIYAALVTFVGRRSEMLSALAGRPVDERWEHINLEACAYALGLSAVVVLVAFVVADVSRMDWTPYAFMAGVIAISYIGSLTVLRVRR